MRQWRSNLLWGAFWGMIAWQVYAVVEYALTTLHPLLAYKNMTIAALHWKLSFLLFGVYTLAGIVTGGVAGVIAGPLTKTRPRGQRPPFQAVGTLTLVLAFIANLVASALEPAMLMVSLAVAALLIFSLSSQIWSDRFALLANAWGTATFLLLAAEANEQLLSHSALMRCVCSIALAGVFIGTSMVGRRIWAKYSGGELRQAAALSGIFVALVLGSGVLSSSDVHAQGNVRQAAPPDVSKPNVILIVLDTVRADHMSLYKYDRNTTPNLETFAQSASVFTHATAAGDMTLTSHAAILTGTYASWNGVQSHRNSHGGGVPISDKYPMLAEILSEHGYSTAAVVANSGFLTPEWGFDRGFQFFDFRSAVRMMPSGGNYYLRSGARQLLHYVIDTSDFDMMFLRAEEINAQAYHVLDRSRRSGRPFFLFLNYMDAHSPYIPPAPFDRMYPGGRDLSIADDRYGQLFEDLAAAKGQMTERERQHYTSQYDGAIAYMDTQIGQLILRLKQLDLYENTLIIITSDHGEALGERGVIGHGLSVYQDQVFVPLIVRYPGNDQEQVVDERVGHTDILPTIMEVTGVPAPPFVQGVSLRGSAGGAGRQLVSESFPHFALIGLNKRFDRTERAIYSGRFKYIGSTAGKRELYDVSTDPAEAYDLCPFDGARCAEMQQDLDEWAKDIPRNVGRKVAPVVPDPQTLERLRVLGYVGRKEDSWQGR